MTNGAIIRILHANSLRNPQVVKETVIKVETAIALEVIMQLKKQSNPSARWNFETNSWSVGESHDYQWYHEKTKEHSPWMNLDDALVWIQKRDQEKILESQRPPGKISNSSEK